MTTYLTDRHGQRWALVPVDSDSNMIEAAEGVEDLYKRGTPRTWAKVFRQMTAAAPDFEPAQVTDAELDAVMPLAAWDHFTPKGIALIRQAMRAAMALWSKT
jgi:hypothetical protein